RAGLRPRGDFAARPTRPRAGHGRVAPGPPRARPFPGTGANPAAPGGPARHPHPGRTPHHRVPRRAAAAARLAGGPTGRRPARRAAGVVGDLPPLSRGRRMNVVLVRKLLRDARTGLLVVCLLLGAFEFLWGKATEQAILVVRAVDPEMSIQKFEKMVFNQESG